MRFKRIPIAAMMGIVLVAALALAAFKNTSPIVADIVYTTTMSLLLFSTVGMILRRGLWTGFAVFGWGFFLMMRDTRSQGVLGFPTFRVLRPLYDYLDVESGVYDTDTSWDYFEQTGTSIIVLVAGIVGVMLTHFFFSQSTSKS